MSIKISELPQATSVGSSDIVPIVQGGTTKQATAGMIQPTMTALTITGLSSFTISANHSCAIETGAGKLVTINISINGVSCSSNTWTNIAQIPEGYRPVGNEAYGYITVANNAYVITSTYIAVSGIIGIKTSSSLNNANVRVQTSYFVPNDSATRSLNLTRSENTGSLVGLGDKAEVTDEVTEVKEAEAKTEEIEKEGSGDER